ncbi:GNAT family N-acetyltransferase [Pseudozobellia thermophila]|uniref:Phosphinothricin acetyltransferase n=1 Tax=Pseudozobellia thermophila TaxID=192903 RepID=A0A1M6N865_9FLAO|nr:GNAT family N-acetyltransferase [Pseudozobellia thermophila]SHJ91930.1 phosphinothricin acetyltransferase [Pseudozobellia thermophila]
MTIEVLHKFELDEKTQRRISELYKQLNSIIVQRPLHQILQEDNHVLFVVCKEGDDILGIALMAMYKVISGYRGMVEDVVVDEAHRGKGIGRKLMEKLLEEARHRGLDEVMLFSGHHRKPAIGLYKSLGFQLRPSGLYNLKLSE